MRLDPPALQVGDQASHVTPLHPPQEPVAGMAQESAHAAPARVPPGATQMIMVDMEAISPATRFGGGAKSAAATLGSEQGGVSFGRQSVPLQPSHPSTFPLANGKCRFVAPALPDAGSSLGPIARSVCVLALIRHSALAIPRLTASSASLRRSGSTAFCFRAIRRATCRATASRGSVLSIPVVVPRAQAERPDRPSAAFDQTDHGEPVTSGRNNTAACRVALTT